MRRNSYKVWAMVILIMVILLWTIGCVHVLKINDKVIPPGKCVIVPIKMFYADGTVLDTFIMACNDPSTGLLGVVEK